MNSFLSKPLGKIIVGILSTYLVIVLSIIAYNSGNGRYMFRSEETNDILDTKSGKIYYYDEGKLIEIK